MQILIVMGLLVTIMGWAATLAGFAVTVVMIPSSTLVGRYLQASRKEMLKHTDARVKLSTEIVTGIKAIKLYAWEDPYVQRIGELREQELKQIRRTQLLTALNTAVFMVCVLPCLRFMNVLHDLDLQFCRVVLSSSAWQLLECTRRWESH